VAAVTATPVPLSDPDWALGLALDEVVADYVEALRAAGRSPRTIEWYRAFLAEFGAFVVARDAAPAHLADLAPSSARRWLVTLQARSPGPAPASLAGRIRTLKAFGSWIAAEYDLAKHPLAGLQVPKVPDQLVRSLRDSDVRRLLAAVEARSRQPERDRAVVLLLLDSGLRIGEAAGLRIGDVDLQAGRCRVMGKGARERVVPLGRTARRALRRYLLTAGHHGRAEAPLFAQRGGEPLAVAGLQHLIRRMVVGAGDLSVRCTPHVLRHTFARNFLTNGGDVFSLQRILGHSPASLEITRRYVRLLDDDLREAHRRASPVDRLALR
jgi:site-specific recombinase XerD